MINKVIHYCWFGNKPKTELVNFCINSWKNKLADYELMEWNESTFDVKMTKFTNDAYNKKKWAFVSDYVRAYALYNYGGIYMDTDVEVKHSLDEFLCHGAFTSFETINYPFSALWGAQRGHQWPLMVMKYYERQDHFEQITNTSIVSDLLVEEYGVNKASDTLQILKDGIYIYPSNYFCLDLPINFATHHFAGSWISESSHSINKIRLRVSFLSKVFKASIIEDQIFQDNEGYRKRQNHVYYEILKCIPKNALFKFIIKEALKIIISEKHKTK